jgi:arsenite-transporting ATPase
MRIIAFTGTGGSGVSTLAAATALALSAGGTPTLAFGLGRGLSAAFDVVLGPAPSQVATGLDAVEAGAGGGPDEFCDWLEDLFEWRGIDTALAADIAALPGLNHIGRLLELESFAAGGSYEAIVVDGAPLGQFLDLPAGLDAAARWLDRLFAPRQQTVLEPFLRMFAGDYAAAGNDVLDRGRELLGRLVSLRDTLTDAETSTVRLVTLPERRAQTEVMQALSVLSLFTYNTDAVIVNKLLPDSVTDPFFEEERREQGESLRKMAALSSMPLLSAALSASPPRGAAALAALAAGLYRELDAGAVFVEGATRSLERNGDGYVLHLRVPHVTRDQLRLEQMEDALAVHVNGRRCVLRLPGELRYHEAQSWALEGEDLRVSFVI